MTVANNRPMLLTDLTMTAVDFEAATGWAANPEGMCKGAVCVPAPGAVTDGSIDVAAVAARLGMALVHDDAHGVWSLGPGEWWPGADDRRCSGTRTARRRRQPVQALGDARPQGAAGRLGVVVRLP